MPGMNSSYTFNNAPGGPTAIRMLQPGMNPAPMQPPPRYQASDDFVNPNAPPNVVVSSSIAVAQSQPSQMSQVVAPALVSSIANSMGNPSSTISNVSLVTINNGGPIVQPGVANQN